MSLPGFSVFGVGHGGSLKEEKKDPLQGIFMFCTHFLLPLQLKD